MASDQARIPKDASASIYALRNDNSKKVNNKEKKKNDNLPLKIAVSFGAERGI